MFNIFEKAFSIYIIFLIYGAVSWVINVVQLLNAIMGSTVWWSDKAVIIHALGLLFPLNAITVWL